MKSILIIFTLISIISKVHCTEKGHNVTESSRALNSSVISSVLADKYPDFSSAKEFEHFWKSINRVLNSTDVQLHHIADQISQISVQLNQSSSSCYQLIEQAFRLGYRKQWSGKMINSNTFSTNGFVNGLISDRYTSLGDFLGCISEANVSATTTSGEISFAGKYCIANLNTPKLGYYSRDVQAAKFSNLTNYLENAASNWLILRNRYPMAMGICAPSVCSPQELTTLIGKYFEPYLDGIDIEVGYCQVNNEPKKIRLGFIIALSIIVFMIMLSLLATFISKIASLLQTSTAKVHPTSSDDSKASWPLLLKFIDCFNIENNMRSLFKVESKEKLSRHAFDLRFIHGMKAVIMLATVYVHSAIFLTIIHFSKLSPFTRFPTFFYQMEKTFGLFHGSFVQGFMLVDVFFNMSGFLVTYTVLSKAKSVPNFFSYVFLRYLRLLPSVVAVICLTILVQKAGKGPMFHEDLTKPFVEPCYEYWWTHVLFIHNFFTAEKMCGPNLWFIAADWQLHVLLYVVLFLYYRKKYVAYVTAFILMTGSMSAFLLFNYLDFPGWPRSDFALRFHGDAPMQSIRLYYTSPQAHVMAYVLGALIAMKLIKMRKPPASSKLTDSLIMIFIVFISFLVLYPIKFFDAEMNEVKDMSFLVWFILFFVATMICEAFLFYYFVISKDFFLKRILSTKFLVPLGRLTYGIYLVNPLVNWFSILQNWDSQTLTIMMVTVNFGSNYLQCFFIAIALYIFFQSPVYNVVQLLVTHRYSSERKNNHNNTPTDSHLSMTNTSSHLMNRSAKTTNGNGEHMKL